MYMTTKTAENTPKTASESRKKMLENYERDQRPVKGIFKYPEVPGGTLKFTCKLYPGDVQTHTLTDGGIYELPLGVAKHLRRRGKIPIHEYYRVDENTTGKRPGQYETIFDFESLEFADFDDTHR